MKKVLAMALVFTMALGMTAMASAATITASGRGEVLIMPDRATVSLGVRASDGDVTVAQSAVNACIEKVRAALYALGVEPKDLSVGYLAVYPVYDYSSDEQKVRGYEVSHDLSVKVYALDKLGALIDAALTAGANQLGGVSFELIDDSEAFADALKLATDNAARHAQTMAEAAGLQITGLTDLKQEENYYAYGGGFAMSKGADEAATSVDIGELIVSASVSAVYTAQ